MSIALHAALLLLWLPRAEPMVEWRPPQLPHHDRVVDDGMTVVEIIDEPVGNGGGGAASARATVRQARSAWQGISVGREVGGGGTGTGSGSGNGSGDGDGNGIGFGAIHVEAVPAPPPAPAPEIKVSRARPAKLIWPKRDEAVDDDADLFVAKVTVDAQGDVVGAHMVKTRPGAKADHAANAIWTFRYEPALDDDARPVRSTFDQPFQVR